jgi:GrpB-like predicted nucleotidyltransferase (UPF0157 family)
MRFLAPEEYQPLANEVFRTLAARISATVVGADVHHVGSSAVPSLISKGDLDIYVGVPAASFSEAMAKLEKLEDFHMKLDTLRTDALSPFEVHGFPLDVGVQLVAQGSQFEFFLTFRDLLMTDPDLRERYNALKRASVGLDEVQYRAAKAAFIEGVLRDHAARERRNSKG